MSAQFYFDIVCPYAYMAFTFLHRAGLFASGRLTLKPILLGGLFKEMKTADDPNRSLTNVRAEYLQRDIERQAELFGVTIKRHERHPLRTVSAMRLITACAEEKRLSLTERLYQAYWRDNIDIDDGATLAPIMQQFGIGDDDMVAAKDALFLATREAFEQKIFGVPTITIGADRYFGADRLELCQEALGFRIDDVPWGSTPPIDFYFDFSSPYSYLAFGEVKRAMAAGARFTMTPILLGALFKEIGTQNIPLLCAHPNKASYLLQDMQAWARLRGQKFVFNSRFPVRTVTALRVAIVEPRAIDAIYSAAWADDRDIGDDQVLQGVLDKAGFGEENLLERAQDHRIKEQLKENTATAISRGVFGVPTFFVRGEKVFGQDRFLWMRRNVL
jgi:2-hydroxychromene-2-carboxylate isomerase